MALLMRFRPAHLDDSKHTPKAWLTMPIQDELDMQAFRSKLGLHDLPRGSLMAGLTLPERFHFLANLGSDFDLRELDLLARLMFDMEPEALDTFTADGRKAEGCIGILLDTAWDAATGEPAPHAPYTEDQMDRYLSDYAELHSPKQSMT